MDRRPALTVLDITKWYGERSGGVRTYLDEKRRYVRERPELRHVLVIPGERDSADRDGNTVEYRVRGPQIPTQAQYRFLLAPRTLRRIIEREQPDVIEVGSPIFVPWITRFATRGRRTPMVAFHHTNIAAALSPVLGPLSTRFSSFYVRRLDRLFATTFAASDASEAELRRAGASRITRVTLGVDLQTFNPIRRTRRVRTRALLGLPLDTPLVSYVGRLAPEKGLDVVVSAWREVEARMSATLVLMGDGPMRGDLRRRTSRMNIRWLPYEGDRRRVASLIAASDVYLSPGPNETFGLAAVEAMACGTPLVAADTGGVAERVRKSGAGSLFRAGQAHSLAHCLLSAVQGDPPRAGELGRAYVERHHAWDLAFDEIFAVYREIARQ